MKLFTENQSQVRRLEDKSGEATVAEVEEGLERRNK